MAEQISVFLEKQPERLQELTDALSEGNINIRVITIQDVENCQLVKLVVDKPEDGLLHLKTKGFTCLLKRIIAIRLEDDLGNFQKLVKLLAEKNLELGNIYGLASQKILCIESKEGDQIEEFLESKGMEIIDPDDLYGI